MPEAIRAIWATCSIGMLPPPGVGIPDGRPLLPLPDDGMPGIPEPPDGMLGIPEPPEGIPGMLVPDVGIPGTLGFRGVCLV